MQNLMFLDTLKFFTENPYREVYLRQLARELKLSPFATKKYLDFLVKKNLVCEERKANLRYFKANTASLFFKYLKIAFGQESLSKSGLIDFLREEVPNTSSIVLFGSMAKGEDDKGSDVDILIIGKGKPFEVGKFEESIGKRIVIHIFNWSEWNRKAKEDKAFYYEIITHGIPLFAELPLISSEE